MILITGCDSTAGRVLVNKLIAKNNILRCHDIYPPKNMPEGCEVISGMLDSDREIKRALIGVNTLIHFLEISEPGTLGRNFMKRINVDISQKLLTAAAASGVSHAIIRSSWQIYGQTDQSPADESRPLRPRSPLGKDKKNIEAFCSSQKLSPMKMTILRPAFTIGPETDNTATLLMLYLALAQENESRTNIINNGENIFEFLAYSDLAKAVEAAVEKKPGGVFNLSGGGSPATSDLAQILKKIEPKLNIFNLSYLKAKYLSLFFGIIKSHHLTGEHMMMLSKNLLMDTSAAKNALGWNPEFDSESIFEETAKWYREIRMKTRISK